MKIKIRNQSGFVKEVKVGFSWTTLLFGFFVPLFRGDWKWFAIMFIVCMITYWIACIPFAFIYNKQYLKDMIEKGWAPTDRTGLNILLQKGIITNDIVHNYTDF